MPTTFIAVIAAWRLTNALDLQTSGLVTSAAAVGAVIDLMLF